MALQQLTGLHQAVGAYYRVVGALGGILEQADGLVNVALLGIAVAQGGNGVVGDEGIVLSVEILQILDGFVVVCLVVVGQASVEVSYVAGLGAAVL